MTAELLDGNGNPLSKSLILFYLNDEKIGVTETDHNGIAKIVVIPEKKGANRIKAEYEGSGSLEPSIIETMINVKALKSQLLFSPPRYALEGFGVRPPVLLQDSNGEEISHAKIKIEVISNGEVIESKTLETDEMGKAFVDVTTRFPGTLTLKILFDGGRKYEAIQGEYRVGIVSRMLVLLMLVSAAAVAILVTFFKLGWIQRFSSKISDAGRSYGMMEEIEGYGTCVSCGTAIPSSSKFCDRCGAIQDERQTDSIRLDIDEEVFNYIVGKGGEISVSQAAKDLGITKKQLMEAVDRLKGAGRLE